MDSQKNKLIDLACEKFGSLTSNDLKLLHAASLGRAADFRTDDTENSIPCVQNVETQSLQSNRIVWLCTNSDARKYLTYLGLKIIGAKIEGILDLQFAVVDFPLIFDNCIFTEALIITSAQLYFLNLSGSSVISIDAEGIKIGNSLLAKDNFRASKEINLRMASIGGNLDFSSAILDSPNSDTLIASGAEINGAILLSENFKSIGRVRLNGIRVGSNLECWGSEFSNQNNDALDFDGACIGGCVKLNNGFKAQGVVRLVGARIKGNFSCDGGNFDDLSGFALLADSINVEGSVLLRNGFNAIGQVRFLSACINSVFSCNGGSFSNLGGDSLLLDDIFIKGSATLGQGFQSYGSVRLCNATIDGCLSCEAGLFINPEDEALNASNVRVSGDVILANGFSAHGIVRFNGAKLQGSFSCQKGTFFNPNKEALILDNSKVENSVALCDHFQAVGATSLINARVGGNINCSRGTFCNSITQDLRYKNIAIIWILLRKYNCLAGILYLHQSLEEKSYKSCLQGVLKDYCIQLMQRFDTESFTLCFQGADIKGSVYLQDECRIVGMCDFADSKIGNTLLMTGISTSENIVINLQSTETYFLADNPHSWPKKGNLNLDGFIYKNISRESPLDHSLRLGWVRLQYQEWRDNTTFLFSPQPYENLAQVLKNNGHEKAAVKILIGREEDRTKFENFNRLEKLWRCILKHTIAFGYRPSDALVYITIIIIFGAIFFSYGKAFDLITPSLVRPYSNNNIAITGKVSENYQTLNPLLYSLDISLPIIDLQQQKYWLPNSNKGAEVPLFKVKHGSLLRYWYWFQSIMGWLLSSLWVLAFTGIVRR